MNRSVVTSYSTISKWLHWVVATLVILMLTFSFYMDEAPEQYQSTVYMLHKSFGLTIFFLMLWRLSWIIYKGKPLLPENVTKWEKYLAAFVQYALYLSLFLQSLSGWILSVAENRIPTFWGLFNMPLYGIPVNKELSHTFDVIHLINSYVLIGLIVLHILGAMKHAIIDKDKILERMF